MTFHEQMEALRTRLAFPLPGTVAQLTMAPAYRQDPRLARVRDKACREAGVLALLFPLAGAPAVLLTVRRGDLRNHGGQISFPGGRRDPGETLEETALREAEEEVCLPPEAVEVLGMMTPLYIPPSNFCVYPTVGVVDGLPPLRPADAEVEAILEVPIAHLRQPSARQVGDWTLRGRPMQVPFFDVDGHTVWGATAMMLAELLTLFEEM